MGRGRQGGFSLIIVFLLIIVMVGLAAAVMTTTQGDLKVAGTDREGALSFYAAEAGIAYAKDWLTQQAVPTGSTAFSGVLGAAGTQICQPVGGVTPGTQPKVAQTAVVYLKDASNNPITWYRFCLHNNVDDPGYINLAGNADTVDADGKITIEAYGTGPNNTSAHVAATVAVSTSLVGVSDYGQQGGGGTKQARGDSTGINTGTVVRY